MGASTRPIGRGVSLPLSAVSFRSAVALPAIYLPLLFYGIESLDWLAVFPGLFGLHVLAPVWGGVTPERAG